jgi:predicted XRE-type DNA-binding protein
MKRYGSGEMDAAGRRSVVQIEGMPIAPDDPVLPFRRQLAREIVRSLGPNPQYVVGPGYGIPQPRMSELERGRVERFSLEWLIRRIYILGGSVSISVTLGDARMEYWRRVKARNLARERGEG